MKSDYLTQEELYYSLEHEGLDVSERTIRFWISKGVLEKPLRKPYKYADGRKRYFPTRVVGEILDIVRLQEEGWKLTQIKKRLRSPVKVSQVDEAGAQELAKRFLADFLSNGEFRDRIKMIEGAESSTPPWRRVRNFLVARLTHFVGRKQAVRSVTSFMLGLSKREVAKLLRMTSNQPSGAAPAVKPEDRKWTRGELELIAQTVSSLRPPHWGADAPEPIVSRRLRTEFRQLEDAAQVDEKVDLRTLNGILSRLRGLHEQVRESSAFLAES
jgi:DNA-binding transcriptional MerR regulator